MAFQAVNFGQYPMRSPTQYVCLSTDAKTTGAPLAAGDHLLELDTGRRYIFVVASSTNRYWQMLPDSPEFEAKQQTELLQAILDELKELRQTVGEALLERALGS